MTRQEVMAVISISGCHWSYPTSALDEPPPAVSARIVHARDFVTVAVLPPWCLRQRFPLDRSDAQLSASKGSGGEDPSLALRAGMNRFVAVTRTEDTGRVRPVAPEKTQAPANWWVALRDPPHGTRSRSIRHWSQTTSGTREYASPGQLVGCAALTHPTRARAEALPARVPRTRGKREDVRRCVDDGSSGTGSTSFPPAALPPSYICLGSIWFRVARATIIARERRMRDGNAGRGGGRNGREWSGMGGGMSGAWPVPVLWAQATAANPVGARARVRGVRPRPEQLADARAAALVREPHALLARFGAVVARALALGRGSNT